MHVARWLRRLAVAQLRRPSLFVAAGALVLLGSLPFVLRLRLDSSWAALLPQDKPSVRDLEAARDRVAGLSTLTVVLESRDLAAMQRFATALATRLEAHGSTLVRNVDWTVEPYRRFVESHRHLYAELSDLREVRDTLKRRIDWERARANPFFVDLDDEAPPDVDGLLKRLRAQAQTQRERFARYPGGFYVHSDRDLLVLFVRSDVQASDLDRVRRLISEVQQVADGLDPRSYAPDLRVRLWGELFLAQEEHAAIVEDLTLATALVVIGTLLSVWLFFGTPSSIPLLGLFLVVPVTATFAWASWAVGSLNTSTAFLGSIVVGNGINPGIIWLARYFEARRAGRRLSRAVREAHLQTWVGTLTASCAAGLSYASLVLTDFRGFRDFGLIGGMGMALCWISTFTLLPALTVVAERRRVVGRGGLGTRRVAYGALPARLVARRPRATLAVSLVLTVAAVAAAATRAKDPIEYNFRKLRSERQRDPAQEAVSFRVDATVGRSVSGNAIAVLASRREDVPILEAELLRRRDRGGAPYGSVRSLDDLLPRDQEQKIPVLREIRGLGLDLLRHATSEQKRRFEAELPGADLRPLRDDDLPANMSLPFEEKDGSRGKVLLVGPKDGRSVWDGRYLMDWAAALRDLRDPFGERPLLAGRAPLFADLVQAVFEDGPRAVAASLLVTTAMVLLAFRRWPDRLLSLAALLLGVIWMTGAAAALGMKLNFLNFVAFPISFGNGVDYGVNLLRRVCAESGRGAWGAPKDAVLASLLETGGAVFLCSLTTAIGYASLCASANLAINSFGIAMVISEATCVLVALVTLPALLVLVARRSVTATKGEAS